MFSEKLQIYNKKQARFILWLCIDSVMNLVKALDLFDEFDEFDEFSHILPDLQPLFLQPTREEAFRLSIPSHPPKYRTIYL